MSSVLLILLCAAGFLALVTVAGLVLILVVARKQRRPAATPTAPAAKPDTPAKEPAAPAVSRAEALAAVARRTAQAGLHGEAAGLSSNLQPLLDRFPGWTLEALGGWSAAFVYHCVCLAGEALPSRFDHPDVHGNFALCAPWEEWGRLTGAYTPFGDDAFTLCPGDIVLYDRLVSDRPCDHMGVVLSVEPDCFTVAEGDVNNLSACLTRPLDEHLRGRIRLA